MDANSKLGPRFVPSAPGEQSKNGKMLERVIKENDLIVVNGMDLCEGIITRFRKTINKDEKSFIDYFLVCRRFFELIIMMKIDEERIYSLTKFSNKKGAKDLKESDHNTMILKVKTNWKNLVDDKDIRTEIYNFKKKDDFKIFQVETSNNEELRACFNDENDDLEVSSKRWLSILNKIIIKCFKRIRLNKKKN